MRTKKCKYTLMLQINSDPNRNTSTRVICLIRFNDTTVEFPRREGMWIGQRSLER